MHIKITEDHHVSIISHYLLLSILFNFGICLSFPFFQVFIMKLTAVLLSILLSSALNALTQHKNNNWPTWRLKGLQKASCRSRLQSWEEEEEEVALWIMMASLCYYAPSRLRQLLNSARYRHRFCSTFVVDIIVIIDVVIDHWRLTLIIDILCYHE